MLQTRQEEKQLAMKNNEYHQNVPSITVMVDGGWSKRSQIHSYDANLGIGVIFGAATKSCCARVSKINTVQYAL